MKYIKKKYGSSAFLKKNKTQISKKRRRYKKTNEQKEQKEPN